jgi:O-antigen/teichoic acid export membrane protein
MQLSPHQTLRQNFSWTFAGNVIYSACQWGMLVVLAKLGSPEMVGQFTLSMAITAPVIMFTNLQLRGIQATDAKQQFCFGDYLGLRLLGTGLALLIIAGIALKTNYSGEMILIILVMGLAKASESISDVFYGLIQQHERMDRISKSLMVKGPLSLFLLGIGVLLTRSVVGGVVGLAIAWLVVLLAYDIPSGLLMLQSKSKNLDSPFQSSILIRLWTIRVRLKPRWDYKTLRKLIWLALPLGIVMMLISLNVNIPRYFIEQYLGKRELGIFAAISYLMVLGGMVVNALGESASPRLAKYYADGNHKAFGLLLLKVVGIGILLGGGGVLMALVAGKPILTLLYSAEYAQRSDLFVWLMVVSGINYVASFLGYGMTAARYFHVQMPLFTLVTSASALACFWLIPSSGLQGAVIALIVAALIQIVFSLGVIIYAIRRIQLS